MRDQIRRELARDGIAGGPCEAARALRHAPAARRDTWTRRGGGRTIWHRVVAPHARIA
jgi:hypothetical protein